MADDKDKQERNGCLRLAPLLLLAYFVLDSFGDCVLRAASVGHGLMVFALGLAGCGGGVALGLRAKARTNPPTLWSSSFPLIYGLFGLSIPTFITLYIIFRSR